MHSIWIDAKVCMHKDCCLIVWNEYKYLATVFKLHSIVEIMCNWNQNS